MAPHLTTFAIFPSRTNCVSPLKWTQFATDGKMARIGMRNGDKKIKLSQLSYPHIGAGSSDASRNYFGIRQNCRHQRDSVKILKAEFFPLQLTRVTDMRMIQLSAEEAACIQGKLEGVKTRRFLLASPQRDQCNSPSSTLSWTSKKIACLNVSVSSSWFRKLYKWSKHPAKNDQREQPQKKQVGEWRSPASWKSFVWC